MAALARASHSSIITQAPGPLATAIPTLTARVHTGPKSIWVCILDARDVHTEGVLCACMHVVACLHMCALAHVGTCVCTCMHTHACWCMCVHECTCVHACVCSPACTHVHAPRSVWSRKGFPSFQSHHSAVRIGEAQPTRSSRCCISLSSPRCHP